MASNPDIEFPVQDSWFNLVHSNEWWNVTVWTYLIVIICSGLILHSIILKVLLFNSKCNGILYFLLQLTFADLIALVICYFELLYTFNRKWRFGSELCSIYSGLYFFSTTATVYFVIIINMHSISTANLALRIQSIVSCREERAGIMSDDIESSSISNYDASLEHRRTMTIDYGKRWKTSISVVVPALLIWLLAFSTSIPSFVLSTTIPRNEYAVCDIMRLEGSSINVTTILILVIRVILPFIALTITLVILLFKRKSLKNLDENATDESPTKAVFLSIILTICYLLIQSHNLISSLIFSMVDVDSIKDWATNIHIVLMLIFYTLTISRPIIYMTFHPKIRNKIFS